MMDQMIFGLIVVLVALVCGTILLYKRMSIQDKEDQERRRASEESLNKIRSDKFRLLYEQEAAEHDVTKTKLNITRKQLELARATMAKVKIKEVTA